MDIEKNVNIKKPGYAIEDMWHDVKASVYWRVNMWYMWINKEIYTTWINVGAYFSKGNNTRICIKEESIGAPHGIEERLIQLDSRKHHTILRYLSICRGLFVPIPSTLNYSTKTLNSCILTITTKLIQAF